MLFAGGRVPTQVVNRKVQPADVAPTLAAIPGMSPPASAQGTILPEVFEGKRQGVQAACEKHGAGVRGIEVRCVVTELKTPARGRGQAAW